MRIKFKLILGMMAMLGCLLAASQLHAHEAGLHDLNHSCISCDIDDISAHGAAPASSGLFYHQALSADQFVFSTALPVQTAVFSAIRAPPYLS